MGNGKRINTIINKLQWDRDYMSNHNMDADIYVKLSRGELETVLRALKALARGEDEEELL